METNANNTNEKTERKRIVVEFLDDILPYILFMAELFFQNIGLKITPEKSAINCYAWQISNNYATNVSMILRDDSTNAEVTYSVSTTTDKNYLVLSQALALTEGRFYDLTIKEGSSVIFKDKVFCFCLSSIELVMGIIIAGLK